jgi:hypothetical protein
MVLAVCQKKSAQNYRQVAKNLKKMMLYIGYDKKRV